MLSLILKKKWENISKTERGGGYNFLLYTRVEQKKKKKKKREKTNKKKKVKKKKKKKKKIK